MIRDTDLMERPPKAPAPQVTARRSAGDSGACVSNHRSLRICFYHIFQIYIPYIFPSYVPYIFPRRTYLEKIYGT